jgi:hypothetical protein
VTVKDGQQGTVLVGNSFHELVDKTETTFKTGNIVSFTGFLKARNKKTVIYYRDESVEAWPEVIDRYSKKIAECSCAGSPELGLILKYHKVDIPPKELEDILRAVRPCLDDAGKALLDHVKNIKVSKTTHVEQSSDNAGNFAYSVSRENAETEQFEMPQKLVFTVQIFDQCPETVELEFEPRFFWEEEREGVKMNFSYDNPRTGIILREARRNCLEKYLETLSCEKYYGSIDTTVQDDSWKYKANPLTDK